MLRILTALAFSTATLAGSIPALAQQKWPERAVTVIVPFGAGGNADILGRIFAERLAQRLGQPVIIENRVGAAGNTGVAAIAKARPDGYTIGVGTVGAMAINPHIYKEKMPFEPFTELKPLMVMATQPNILVVNTDMPVRSLPELIAYLKVNPDKESYGTSGVGSTLHLCMEMIVQATGVRVAPVAYRASNQVLQDVIGGQIRIACDNASTALEQVRGGKLRPLGVTSPKRYAELPDVPAIAETIPGFDALTWHAFVAPAGLPQEIVDKLIGELSAIAKEPEIAARLKPLGLDSSGIAGADFERFHRAEFEKWKPIIEKAGIKAP
jgi:tripartite-type tricarboxylate transporter receptor subunit TctC